MGVNRPTPKPVSREKENSGNRILNMSMRRAILSFVKLFYKKQSTVILYLVMKLTVAKIDEQRTVNCGSLFSTMVMRIEFLKSGEL